MEAIEKWKQIEGYPNYEVSDQGRVRNIKTGHILKPGDNGNGYFKVHLSQNGKVQKKFIHRLVGMAFISNPDNLPQINHRNENPADNRVENLEWCTCEYNNNYGSHNARGSLSKSKPVEQYDLDGNYIRSWISGTEASKQLGINEGSISSCCIGRKGFKTAGGFIWKFAEKID